MSPLSRPLTLRSGATLKNRVALAAMTNPQSNEDGTLGDDELHWLEMRAKGGFSLIATCASHVAREGQGFPRELACYGDQHRPGLARLAGAIHAHGALALVQIFHGGLRANRELMGEVPWSASLAENVREASEEDIARVIRQFGEAAARCERAGFDGVEVHGAHGYLLTQFLSVTENRRNDGWGGSLEHRARLIREVVREVRDKTSPGFTVGVRLSPEEWGNAKGVDLDESLQVARWLAEDGVDFVHLSLWDAMKNTKKRPDAHAVTLFRDALAREVALFAAGSLWTRDDALSILDRGADVVALGRSAILNPDWPRHMEDEAWEPKRPPATRQELRDRGLSDLFVDYMSRWKNFVSG